jgi:hypothetical protein
VKVVLALPTGEILIVVEERADDAEDIIAPAEAAPCR